MFIGVRGVRTRDAVAPLSNSSKLKEKFRQKFEQNSEKKCLNAAKKSSSQLSKKRLRLRQKFGHICFAPSEDFGAVRLYVYVWKNILHSTNFNQSLKHTIRFKTT